jgi:hypothetical protein
MIWIIGQSCFSCNIERSVYEIKHSVYYSEKGKGVHIERLGDASNVQCIVLNTRRMGVHIECSKDGSNIRLGFILFIIYLFLM